MVAVPGEQDEQHAAVRKLPRRATDLIEDVVVWVLLSASLLLVAAALIAGVGAHGRVNERIHTQSQDRTMLPARVLAQAPVVPLDPGSRIAVEVEWVGPDGVRRTGFVPVPAAAPAGSEVPVWVDRTGATVDPPPARVDAVAAGIFTGIAVLAVGASVLGVVWLLVRRGIDAVNARRWAREWADIGPEWTGHR
ncbi:hypothetical protein GCM10009608_57550 [Pseudonocardia alaniniphila]